MLASNPKLPEALIAKYYYEGKPEVIARFAANAKITNSMLDEFLYHDTIAIQAVAVSNPNTKVKDLDKLAKIGAPFVREQVCYNANTSLQTLKRLIKDPIEDVRYAAAGHFKVTEEMVEHFRLDKELDEVDLSLFFKTEELVLYKQLRYNFSGTLKEFRDLINVTLKTA